MSCLIGCLGFFAPRLALALLWLLGDGYLQSVFQTRLWPLLGFLFMPLTTLVYAWTEHEISQPVVQGVLVALAVLSDLGLLGGSARRQKRRSKDD